MNAMHPWKLFAIVVGMSMAAGSANAALSCHKINAKGIGQDLGNGSTQATIIGGGILHGTTLGQFSIISVNPPVASFEGTVTFTTKQGGAVVTVDGVLDITTGEFSASGLSRAGPASWQTRAGTSRCMARRIC